MKKRNLTAALLGVLTLCLALPICAGASEVTATGTAAATGTTAAQETEEPLEPELSDTRLKLYKGEKEWLEVVGTDQTVRWSSSNTTVARVNQKGRVTARKTGKAVITAKFGSTKLTCRVTVKMPTIKLNRKKLKVDPGTAKHLTATVNGPSEDVTWKSSSKRIAVVSTNGTVTGKNAGTCVISATANGVTAKCSVTVSNPASISLDQTEVYLSTGGFDVLEATVTGSAGSSSYSWSSSNTNVATIKGNGNTCIVTAVGAGRATITVKYGSLKETCDVTVVNSAEVTSVEIAQQRVNGVETDFLIGRDANGVEKYRTVVASGTATEAYLSTVTTFQNHVYVVTTNEIQMRNMQNGQPERTLSLNIGGSPIACMDNNGYLYAVSSYRGATHIVYKISPYVYDNKLTMLWSSRLNSNFLEPYGLHVSGSYLTVYDDGPYYSRASINIFYGTVNYYT